jgi:phosphoglycolate phosphatase
MPSAVFFDLDGTLADTIEDIANAVNASLGKRKLPCFGIPEYKLMVGNGFRNLVRLALPEGLRTEDHIEELRAEASEAYAAHALDSTRPYPGIRELLAGLAARGIPRAVISNKPDPLTQKVVAGLFPGAGFAFVRGETPGFPRKPDPASPLDIAGRLGLMPGEVIYLGDSNVDMLTAHNAGMIAVGAAWGFRGREELEAAGADIIVEEPEDVLALIGK